MSCCIDVWQQVQTWKKRIVQSPNLVVYHCIPNILHHTAQLARIHNIVEEPFDLPPFPQKSQGLTNNLQFSVDTQA